MKLALTGFTTGVPTEPEKRKYSQEQVESMFKVIEKNQFLGKKITYPVRAVLVGTIIICRNNHIICGKDVISYRTKN
jgi:hypothetical protein